MLNGTDSGGKSPATPWASDAPRNIFVETRFWEITANGGGWGLSLPIPWAIVRGRHPSATASVIAKLRRCRGQHRLLPGSRVKWFYTAVLAGLEPQTDDVLKQLIPCLPRTVEQWVRFDIDRTQTRLHAVAERTSGTRWEAGETLHEFFPPEFRPLYMEYRVARQSVSDEFHTLDEKEQLYRLGLFLSQWVSAASTLPVSTYAIRDGVLSISYPESPSL